MPEWKREIRMRLTGLRLEPAREAEILEKLKQHLEDHYEELLGGGATAEQAYRQTLAELSAEELLACPPGERPKSTRWWRSATNRLVSRRSSSRVVSLDSPDPLDFCF